MPSSFLLLHQATKRLLLQPRNWNKFRLVETSSDLSKQVQICGETASLSNLNELNSLPRLVIQTYLRKKIIALNYIYCGPTTQEYTRKKNRTEKLTRLYGKKERKRHKVRKNIKNRRIFCLLADNSWSKFIYKRYRSKSNSWKCPKK